MIDLYREYDFKNDEKRFMINFKNAMLDKGYNSLSLFHELLQTIGINSYDTARSYYNMRRIIPVDILIKLSVKLNLNITEIMFPDSIPVNVYTKNIANNYDAYSRTFNYFNTVFYLYNDAFHPDVTFKNLDRINSDIEHAANQLSLRISKFNYLLQKYYFADLNEEELSDISAFSINLLVNRETNEKLNWNDVIDLKKNLLTTDFLKEFYNKYTFSIHNKKCFELLELMKNNLPQNLYQLIKNILPELERVDESEEDN